MATGSRSDDVFFGVYDEYVGQPRTKSVVYGYWLVALGVLAVVGGGVAFAVGNWVTGGLTPLAGREYAFVFGAAGVDLVILGLVLQLPLRRRAVVVAVAGAVLALAATGYFLQVYPRGWGPELTTAASLVAGGYAAGVGVVVLVAALVPVVTGRQCLLLDEEPMPALARPDEDDEAEADHSAVLLGEDTRDGVFAVFPSDDGWRWWFVEQTAVADGSRDYERQSDAEAALSTVKGAVADAGLLELTQPTFRLYSDGGEVTWALVDEDGAVVGACDGTYGDRGAAEDDVNLLKEHGPGAALLDVDDGVFEVYGDGDDWRFRLVDGDREVLGESPTGFDERSEAESAVAEVRDRADGAPLMDVEHVGFELEQVEGEWRYHLVDASDVRLATSADQYPTRRAVEDAVGYVAEHAIDVPFLTANKPAYEIVECEDGGWRFRLVDDADEVVLTGEDAVPSAESGQSVVDRLKGVVGDADVLELDPAEFEVFPEGDVWGWRLVTEDRRTIARSPASAAFDTEEAATAAATVVSDAVDRADRIEFDSAAFHLYEAEEGTWNWRLIDSDGSVVSDSGQEHASRADAAAAMSTMKRHAPDAELVEIESAALELYQADGDGEWHWRLVDASGETLATSPRRYETAEEARDAMDTLALLAPDAEMRTMDAAAFQVYVSDEEPRQWRYRLVHPDGNVVATSTDGFPDRAAANQAAEDVAAFADEATAHVVPELAVRFTVEEVPDPEVEDDADEDGTDTAEENADGDVEERWQWEIVDSDREQVVVGTETFPSRNAVATTARLVRDHAGAASVFEVDPAAFRLEAGEEGWRVCLLTADRTTCFVGARWYDSREGARAALDDVRELVADAGLLDFDLAAFEVVESAGSWRWQFVDTAGEVLCASGQTFETRAAAERDLAAVREELPEAGLLEIESPAFELHEDDGAWRWRLVATDGTTVAESMRSAPTRGDAREALASLREYGADAATVDAS